MRTRKRWALVISLLVITGATHADMGAEPVRIDLTPPQLVAKVDTNLGNPAPLTGMFQQNPHLGRLAHVGHCEQTKNTMFDPDGSKHFVLYTCSLMGLSPGVVGDLNITAAGSRVLSTDLIVEAQDDDSAGVAAMTFVLGAAAVIATVDRNALHTGVASQTNLARILNRLAPKQQQIQQVVHADGFVFTRRFLAGDQNLHIEPEAKG
ncbi:hypothetical protein [Rhodanobacter sp. DHB23]|uniref:hypothetical protein n=1 Tax=Rhodanobacter sp. DHB23 TaxID=2775923 RepID=UPI00177AA669|nr:hypothetical protein [Rhodanobacter sp. DHB23]MBD8873760.1 hypothetical protein [Rhodanobacter sp. DHB23]